ncbi:hypothetical protein ES703_96120 [subsurface metagenome]
MGNFYLGGIESPLPRSEEGELLSLTGIIRDNIPKGIPGTDEDGKLLPGPGLPGNGKHKMIQFGGKDGYGSAPPPGLPFYLSRDEEDILRPIIGEAHLNYPILKF